MSNSAEVEAGENNVCANCGVGEVDDIQLEDCDGCDLVKYCGDDCKEEHREQHEEECKTRAVILHDRKLFAQPDISHLGECPLCFLPLPLDPRKSTFYSCCSKTICDGCDYAHYKSSGGNSCPFCREPAPEHEEGRKKRMMKRIKANDPDAMCEMGTRLYHEGDHDKAFEYWTKAAELGDSKAHHNLGYMYERGKGVEKDEEKAVYHYEKAAIGGDPSARFNLGNHEARNGRVDKAVKHYIIAAKLGHTGAMETLWDHYKHGSITKEDLDATLRTHQAAIDATKSPQREAAAAAKRERV